jgi:hypothetical protein
MAKRQTTRISIDCTERVRLPLPHSAEHLLHDLREVIRVLEEYDVDPELASLQWIRRLASDEDALLDRAWDALFERLMSFDDDVSLAYPARYHGGLEISRVQPGEPTAGHQWLTAGAGELQRTAITAQVVSGGAWRAFEAQGCTLPHCPT